MKLSNNTYTYPVFLLLFSNPKNLKAFFMNYYTSYTCSIRVYLFNSIFHSESKVSYEIQQLLKYVKLFVVCMHTPDAGKQHLPRSMWFCYASFLKIRKLFQSLFHELILHLYYMRYYFVSIISKNFS